MQYDDKDGDGNWDEIAFLFSFKPNQKIMLHMAISDHPAAVKEVVRAHVRLRKKNADESFGSSLAEETMPFN